MKKMKKRIAVIANLMGRETLSREVIEANLACAGVPRSEMHVHFTIQEAGTHSNEFQKWALETSDKLTLNRENIGNPQALNIAVDKAMQMEDVDYLCIMGNDIAMPENWLLKAKQACENCNWNVRSVGPGIVSWPSRKNEYNTNSIVPVSSLKSAKLKDTEFLHLTVQSRGNFQYALGTWVFPKKVRERVGVFLEASKYGMWDGRYYKRVLEAGFVNLILCDDPCQHKGTGDANDSEYAKFKAAEAAKARDVIRELPEITSELFYLTSDQLYVRGHYPSIDAAREGKSIKTEEE